MIDMGELPGDESDFTNGQTDYIDFIDDGQYEAPYIRCAYCNTPNKVGYWCSAHCFSQWQREKNGSNYNPYVWPDRVRSDFSMLSRYRVRVLSSPFPSEPR